MKKTKLSLFYSVVSLVLCASMLVGTTFAWFTDGVSTGRNTIAAGNLDVALDYLDAQGNWQSVDENTELFDDAALWEPGYTEVVYLRVRNQGSLALKYQLGVNILSETGSVNVNGDDFRLSDYIEFAAIEGVDTRYADREAARSAVTNASILSAGYTKRGSMEAGEAPEFVALVVYMPETVGNDANHMTGVAAPSIKLGIELVATQHTSETDSFGSDYDSGAELPDFIGKYTITVSAPQLDANGLITEAVAISDPAMAISAEVPAGVKLAEGAEQLVLTIEKTSRSANIGMSSGEVSRSLDVHIEGIATDNAVPMTIHLGTVLPTGLKASSVKLYHVEDGAPVLMTNAEQFSDHNQYRYDSATGEVSIHIKSFSEVTAVIAANDPWDGVTRDTSWYNTTDTTFQIGTAEALAGLSAIVGGMAEGIEQDSFAGKTILLTQDLDLGGQQSKPWYPIGYYNSTGSYTKTSGGSVTSNVYSFEGTFDAQGHIISNIYQNTWDMFGDYNNGYSGTPNHYKDGMGLFGFVLDGTVKDLTVKNFQSDGEFCTTGVVAAYASGTSVFENITIQNSNPRAYNVPNGGVVGYAYDVDGHTNEINFNNITVDSSNKITALWGSWDVGCGGILGRVNGATTVNMTNCEVGAVIDAFNDVCGNYQYYQYRYAGMLVGTVGGDSDPTVGDEKVNFSNVTVYIGNWADYYYCEFAKNSQGSYTEDYQFSRVEKNEIIFDDSTNLPKTCTHEHQGTEDKLAVYLPFAQLYTGYGWGSSPVFGADGVTVIKQFYSVTYMDATGKNVLAVEYATEGERSESRVWADEYTVRSGSITTAGANQKFKYWVNAGSKQVTKIAAGHRDNVILYESWDNPYTARFVDQFGNVIYSETFTKSNPTVNEPKVPEVEDCYGVWGSYDLKNATGDITIRPIYTYAGKLKLTPVDDPADGVVDYYKVEAVDELDKNTYIPGYFNGLPVLIVEKLYKNDSNWDYGAAVETIKIGEGVEHLVHNSLSYTKNLSRVEIPSTLKIMEKNTFSRNYGDDKKVLEIVYNGTRAEWDALVAASNEYWCGGLEKGTTVVCLDGTYTMTKESSFVSDSSWLDWMNSPAEWKWTSNN